MSTQVQRRKGTTVQHATFTGASAELTVDTTKNTVVVHDGATAGGIPLAKETGSAISATSLTGPHNGTVGATTANTGAFTTLTTTGTINLITVGRGAGAVAANTAVGASALAANTSGVSNTAIGASALVANLGGNTNTAVGRNSLFTNTSGSQNTASGFQSLYTNLSGSDNTAFGFYASLTNSTGSNNTSVGSAALFSNTTASNNTAVGYQAGFSNTVGEYSVFLGHQAGYTSNRTADVALYSTFVGALSGKFVTTGSFNTFVGEESGYNVTSGSKNTILGRFNGNQGGLDIRTASNYIVLSDGDGNPRGIFDGSGNLLVGQTSSNFSGNVFSPRGKVEHSINTFNNGDIWSRFMSGTAGAMTLRGSIDTNGVVLSYSVSSDRRLKENIVDAPSSINLLNSIKVRSFNWKENGAFQQYGFIAQELQEAEPLAVTGSETDNSTMGVDMAKLVPHLVKAIQEQQALIESLTQRLTALENK